jgi:pseudouridine-5'-phosphate glycosidase
MIPMTYSAEVQKALDAGTAIVALESTIITHGMPYPQNVETARLVEQDVRDAGATPATIAVIDGTLHIGLEDDTLTALGRHQRFRNGRHRRRTPRRRTVL